jgi:ribosomal-protein-alanine N-acetyltransferase
MPSLAPVLPAGSLNGLLQPTIAIRSGMTLRPWSANDADAVMAAFAVPDIQRWHMRSIDSIVEAEEWIAAWAQRWEAETDASWAVTDQSGTAVGYVALRSLFLPAAQAEVAYWLLPDARGAGLAADAARAVTEWGFTALGLHRIFLTHSVRNEPSCRVAVALGFRQEGTLRDYQRHADGWHSVHIHARLAHER